MAKKKKDSEPVENKAEDTVNTAANQISPRVNGRFAPGHSGNPKGKPTGSRHRASLLAESLIEGKAEELTNKAIKLALGGDPTCLKICLDRLAPIRKDRPVNFDTPPLRKPEDAINTIGSIIQAMGDGLLTAAEATAAANIVGNFVRVIESTEHEERIKRIEEQLKVQKGTAR